MVAHEGEQERRVTRREALRAGGACAGGAAMLGLLGSGTGQALLDRLGRPGTAAADPLAQNAILIVTDSTRADHLGAYGSKLGITPNLDALARDGVTFTRAHPESMPTGPARDTLLTGDRQFPFRHWHAMYTSDHGVLLGEHGLIGKSGRHIHREIHHTPLVVRHPQRRLAGQRNAYFASTNDVAPTLMSFLGVKPGGKMHGQDLTAIFDRRRAHQLAPRSYMTSSYDDYVMAHDGRWLLTMRTDGSDKQLFDTRRDPRELHNVAGRNPATVARLVSALVRDAGGPLPRFTSTGVR